ncbi:hypothetical protein [Nocardia suismassiliense]|uniref:hypothetical protein n=1 Tax=Nocardia suismassiliense TaxID=2077092 RepID=UPI000D1F2D04|nr:hypothetical protein [Nocardia suismassiliense]
MAEAQTYPADATVAQTIETPASVTYRTPITVVWNSDGHEHQDRQWTDAPDDLDPEAFDTALREMGWTRTSDWDDRWEATVCRTSTSTPPPPPTATKPRTTTILRLTPEAVADYEALM